MNTKQRRVDNKENRCVDSWVTVMIGCVVFYGTVISCDVSVSNTKVWEIIYDNGDKEEILVKVYNTVGNPKKAIG